MRCARPRTQFVGFVFEGGVEPPVVSSFEKSCNGFAGLSTHQLAMLRREREEIDRYRNREV